MGGNYTFNRASYLGGIPLSGVRTIKQPSPQRSHLPQKQVQLLRGFWMNCRDEVDGARRNNEGG
jgi:hypothetical protein